jgi:amidase
MHSFCDLWSLRPSFGRVSLRGVVDTLQGQEAVKTSAGPLAHAPEDLDLFMKAYLGSEP